MRRLYGWLILVAVLLLLQTASASPVTIGVMSKGAPGQAARCQAFINGIVDLGTGVYGDLVTGPVVNDLRDSNSATTMLKLDASDIPPTLCTAEGMATTVAVASCTSVYSMTNLRPVVNTTAEGNDELTGFLWNCVKIANLGDPFWIFAECP
jgi:hypothetical protein